MTGVMCRALTVLCLTGFCSALFAQAPDADFDALLQELRESAQDSATLNREREARFVEQKQQREALMREAEAKLANAKKTAAAAKSRYDTQQAELLAVRKTLDDGVGELGQVYSTLRSAAGELRQQAQGSLVSAQFPQGDSLLGTLADGRRLPRLAQIEAFQLWFLRELRAQGEVDGFEAAVVATDGERSQQRVTRVGPFTAFTEAGYLVRGDDGALQLLPRQPALGLRGLIDDFVEAPAGASTAILIDPTRGELLKIESEKPRLIERLGQGGAVGYLILTIGAVGLLLAVLQSAWLTRGAVRVQGQLARIEQPDAGNPLGRVLLAVDEADGDDPELLELKLSEAVVREAPRLERFQGLLRLFVAVAPLLGLLGTVTGMILTFQAITVFGTNDPKLMAGGISQALVTTVLGLVVAIPLLFLNSLLQTRSRAIVQILDEQSALALARRLDGRSGASNV